MNTSQSSMSHLRMALRGVFCLMGLTGTCGLVWALLASLNDQVGAMAFQWLTLGAASATLVSCLVLSVLTARIVLNCYEPAETSEALSQPDD